MCISCLKKADRMSANPQDGAAILRKRLLEASAASAARVFLLRRLEDKRFYRVVEVGVCYKTDSDDVAFGFGVVKLNVVAD